MKQSTKKCTPRSAHGLIPILCVGETLAQNDAGETHAVVSSQVKAALAGVSSEPACNRWSSPMNLFGPSAQAARPRLNKPRQLVAAPCAPRWSNSMATPLPKPCVSSMAAAPTPRTSARSCSSPTLTAHSSAAQPSKPKITVQWYKPQLRYTMNYTRNVKATVGASGPLPVSAIRLAYDLFHRELNFRNR